MYVLTEDVFFYLAIGLAKYVEHGRRYPYPVELRYAMNHLSAAMLTSYPTTITDLLTLFEQSLEKWWPGQLPDDIDPYFELLDEGELHEQLVDFLIEHDLTHEEKLQDIQVVLENRLMVNILNILRNVYISDPVTACDEYTTIRKYITTHPWTDGTQLRKALRTVSVKIQDVSALYHDARTLGSTLLYRRPDMKEASYWNCPLCGPLYQRHNQLGSIKPNACAGRCPGPQGWESKDPADYPWVLKRGIHLRTYIPGTTEIALYSWLTQDVQPTKPVLKSVVLWPGVDRYDLQLTFPGVVWAIDVKDYKDPLMLGKYIAQDKRDMSQYPSLDWQQWYYVYPSYRERQGPDYHARVVRSAGKLPSNVAIISEMQFKELVALQ